MKKALIIGNGMMGKSLQQALEKVEKYEVHISNDHTIFNKEKFAFIVNCSGVAYVFDKTYTIDISSVQHKKNNDLYKNLIFCHPLCGSEKSGRENARADLFENQNCIITTEGKSQELIDFATDIFKEIGMNVFLCDTVARHNKNLAYTSHLLHYLALNGFADLHPVLERLSHSNKEMWKNIFQANKQNIDNAFAELCAIAFVKKINDMSQAVGVLVKDIPKCFYGTALKELLKIN